MKVIRFSSINGDDDGEGYIDVVINVECVVTVNVYLVLRSSECHIILSVNQCGSIIVVFSIQ